MRVWKADVGDRFATDGVWYEVQEGVATEIDGERFVKTQWNSFVPWSDKWRATEREARQDAAARIATYVRLLSQQYADLRQEKADASA